MEQHHPIMDMLGDPGDQTYRQTYRQTTMNSPTKKYTQPPPPPSSVWFPVVRPVDSSGGLLRWTPTKCPLLGSGAPYADVFLSYAAGGTWLGCGLRGVEDGAPSGCPWVPWRIDRRPWRMCFFRRLDCSYTLGSCPRYLSLAAVADTLGPSSDFSLGSRLSLPPSLPLHISLYNRTYPMTLPTNIRVFSWAFSRLHPVGSGLPVSFLTPVSVRAPPPPSLLHGPHHPGPVAP